jgi:hypothetical protein
MSVINRHAGFGHREKSVKDQVDSKLKQMPRPK